MSNLHKLRWKEYHGYLVSEYGDVISKKYPERIMRPYLTKNGYLVIKIFVNQRKLRTTLHRIVALVWLDIPDGDISCYVAHHKDENKLNNHYTNLEWKLKHNHGHDHGIEQWKRGICDHKKRPIIAIDKNGVRTEYESSAAASRTLNISQPNISTFLNKKKKNMSHVGGYTWEYKK